MLVFTRTLGKTIHIGDEIKVAFLITNGQQIRLGIKAPKEVSVLRKEVYERIRLKEAG